MRLSLHGCARARRAPCREAQRPLRLQGSSACASHAQPASAWQTCAATSRSASERNPIMAARVSTE
eukprot:6938425-Prymnesium_polylepis.1